jgi:DeoR/GlpR family transcriptional regulator of sugar metabolism
MGASCGSRRSYDAGAVRTTTILRVVRRTGLDDARFASQDAHMPRADRSSRLIHRLREDGRASVATLARDLGVTPSTIRRDLARLADDGALVRTYGGAALPAASAAPRRGDPAAEAKRAIAAAAATLVEEGQTIAISSGSTTLALARQLVDRRLTVITNALDVASVLLDRDGIELVILGGVVRPRMHSMLGHLAELALRELRADTLFMGIGALDPDRGLMNDSIPEILTDRALRRSARTCVVLADASKFSGVSPAFVFGLKEVDMVVTDAGADPADVVALRARGVRVVVASPAGPSR